MAAKITNVFERVDEPLPIRWTPSAEPPSKKPKRGPRKTSVNMVPSNIAFYSNRSHSSRISTASHLHHSACASLWLRPVRAILYTWLTSLRGTDDLYDATLESARGKFFPVWRKIRNYCFGIFNFDAELEWCKFRAITVYTVYDPNLGWQLECFCILYTFHGKSSASVCKRKRCWVDLNDDMDFQSSSQSTYKLPYACPVHGKATENRVEEMGKRCNGLKGGSWTMTLPQVSMVYQTIYIYPNDKEVTFLD